MRGKLHAYDTLLAELARDLHDMAAELRQFIQEEHAVVGQRDLARHRHVTPSDQPRIRDGLVGGERNGRVMTNAVGQPATVAAMSSTRRSLARMTLATVPR
jgi:hypothetical protein